MDNIFYVDTPELEAMKYAAVKACMDRLHEEYLVWRKLNNIPDELEESNDDDIMLQEGAVNVFTNTEEAATFIEENKPESLSLQNNEKDLIIKALEVLLN